MRFWCRVLGASLVGLSLTIFIIYWELKSADLQWNGDPDLGSSRKKESLDSPSDRPKSASQLQSGKGQNSQDKMGYFRRLIRDTYIYSAFYEHHEDEMDSAIRLIILSGKYYQPKIVCHFCDPSETGCVCPPETAELYTNNENHGRTYGGYIATCGIPACFKNDSPYVFITAEGKEETSEKVRVPLVKTMHELTPFSYAVCIPPLIGQGFDTLHRLIEFIELTRILGAEHFTFYDFDLDDQLRKVLRYYRDQGMVTVLPWNLPDDVTISGQNIWYHGQVLATQDCLYRYQGKSKFVAFNDIDEFIVPLTHSTVPQLLNNIHSKTFCGHCFDSVIFSLNARMPKAKKQSQLISQRVFHRTNDKLSSWSKCIVDPRQVFEMGIHHVSKSRKEQLTMNKVEETLGMVFHYRTCSSAYGIGKACGNLVADYTMEHLGKKLQKKVDEVLKHLEIKPIKEDAVLS